jgi:hypothetical protein
MMEAILLKYDSRLEHLTSHSLDLTINEINISCKQQHLDQYFKSDTSTSIHIGIPLVNYFIFSEEENSVDMSSVFWDIMLYNTLKLTQYHC